ncbi:AraC family transcriptional regulator [Paenibacillus sp. IB182496]|uniref:AraC family transcriptional regulator n=1 Tax=Paenibacillus sabuli TaxID=2772509 RepID=A0A927GTG4_9BACL|nr:AraC family transcriptional regulator [Paenibacillus sabuli]MBD2847799.1 AraC family transcriptional regulator [Paenibacillus sabuli]
MKRSGFARLLFSYLPVFIVTVAALFFLFFIVIANQAREEAAASSQRLATQVLHMLDSQMRFIEQTVVRELLINLDVTAFFDAAQTEDPMVGYSAASSLNSLLVAMPLAESAYLYRVYDQRVLSASRFLEAALFADYEFIALRLEQGTKSDWGSPRMYRETELESFSQVISLSKLIPLGSGDQGMLVVNVSVSRLRDVFASLSGSEMTYLELRDAQGRVLANNGGEAARRGRDDLYRSDVGPWTVAAAIKKQPRGGQMPVATAGWIATGAVIVLLGLIWLLAIVRRHYRPVQSLYNRVFQYTTDRLEGGRAGGSPEGELNYIARAIDSLLVDAQAGQAYRDRHYFREVLEQVRVANEAEWRSLSFGFRWDDARPLLAMIVEIDRFPSFAEQFSERDRRLYQYIVGNVWGELARDEQGEYLFEWFAPERMVTLFRLGDAEEASSGQSGQRDANHLEQRAAAAAEALRAWIGGHLGFTVTVALGQHVGSMTEIALSYEDAVHVLDYRSTLGSDRVLTHSAIAPVVANRPELHALLQMAGDIGYAYRMLERGWSQQFEELFDRIGEGVYARAELASLMDYLLYAIQRGLHEISREVAERWRQEEGAESQRLLRDFETLEELQMQLPPLLMTFSSKVATIRQSRGHHDVVQHAKAFIDDNYANPDLSLMLVSDQLNISYTQLSRLFKEQHGEKFVDYLARRRMSKAAELLRQTPDPVQEVATQVGYMHPFSFIRTFKKLYGMTPGEYRDRN